MEKEIQEEENCELQWSPVGDKQDVLQSTKVNHNEENCESQLNIMEGNQENLHATEKNSNEENCELKLSPFEVKQEILQSIEVNYNEENCGLVQSIMECKPENCEASIEITIIEENCKLQESGLEDVQEILQTPKGNSNEESCEIKKNGVKDVQEILQTPKGNSNEGNCELQENDMEDVQVILQIPKGNDNEENCELQENDMEDVQEIPQVPKGSNNEENCELQENDMEVVQEILQAPKGISNEENCELQEIIMEDQQENLQATEENSNVPAGGMVQNSTIVIDVVGQSYEDNITDRTRREPMFSDSDSDTESVCSSASISSLSSFSSFEDVTDTVKTKKGARPSKSVKTKGELGIEDLPPVEELMISVPEDDMQKIGTVYQIVDQLVVVESFLNSPALDLDTVLFLSHGKPLGHIFEVFGPVIQPYYLIRFNSNEEIIKKEIAKEDSVFYAPSHSNITSFIFTSDLMKQKGSDASWEHNNEPPEEHLDYSDDEKEKAARRKRVAKTRRPDTCEDENPKRVDVSTEAKSDDAASIMSGTFSPKSNNNFSQGRKTGASTNYSHRNILKPSANLKFHTHRQGVVNQSTMGTPRYRFSQDLSFSQTKPRPSHHAAVLQSPFTSTPPSFSGNHQFPGSQLPCVQTNNQDIQSHEKQGVDQNTMVAPQDRISGHFQCLQPRPIQQSPFSPATASYSGNHQFPVPHLPFVQPNNQELQVQQNQAVSENTMATPQYRISGNFPFSQPRPPPQPTVHQQNPFSPLPGTFSGNQQVTGSQLSFVQTNNQEFQVQGKQVVNESTVAAPQHRIPGNFPFSPARPLQTRPPQPTAFQQNTISSAPATISGNHQIPGSPLPFAQTNNQEYQGHERQGFNENTVATPQHRIPGNFTFSQPMPPQSRPPQPTVFQQSSVSPVPATNSGSQQFPSSPLPFVQTNDQRFLGHENHGVNQNTMVAPQHRISGNFPFSPPRTLPPRPPQQNPVPSSPTTFSGDQQLRDSRLSFIQPNNQAFHTREKQEVRQHPVAVPQFNISANLPFSQPPPLQQKPVSTAQTTFSGNRQFPGSQLFMPTSNQRFQGHENQGINQNTMITSQYKTSTNFPFSQPRPHQPTTLQQRPGNHQLPGSQLSFVQTGNQRSPNHDSQGVNQNTVVAPQHRILGNFPFSQPKPLQQNLFSSAPASNFGNQNLPFPN